MFRGIFLLARLRHLSYYCWHLLTYVICRIPTSPRARGRDEVTRPPAVVSARRDHAGRLTRSGGLSDNLGSSSDAIRGPGSHRSESQSPTTMSMFGDQVFSSLGT